MQDKVCAYLTAFILSSISKTTAGKTELVIGLQPSEETPPFNSQGDRPICMS